MNSLSVLRPRIVVKTFSWFAVLLVIALHSIVVRADSTDGGTPLALKPGAPAGSYALSDLDNINPYNGSLNFRLPLMTIGGRGTAGCTMTLPIEQHWRINVFATYLLVYDDGGNGPLPDPQVTYITFAQLIGGRVLSPDFYLSSELSITRSSNALASLIAPIHEPCHLKHAFSLSLRSILTCSSISG